MLLFGSWDPCYTYANIPRTLVVIFGFRIQGNVYEAGFRVLGFGLGIEESVFSVQDSGFRM